MCWHRRLKREVPRALKPLIYNEDHCPELFAFFAKNAPGQILDNGNGNVFRGITNGTPCGMFAMAWDNVKHEMEAMKVFTRAKVKGSSKVMLDTPPDYIIVKILQKISNHD